jgi:hypothetical protein
MTPLRAARGYLVWLSNVVVTELIEEPDAEVRVQTAHVGDARADQASIAWPLLQPIQQKAIGLK